MRKAHQFIVFGSNTDVGKTLISAGLVSAAAKRFGASKTAFIKPLQTGSEEGHSDEKFVRNVASKDGHGQDLFGTTLFSWGPAVSPHLAAEEARVCEGKIPPTDKEILETIGNTLVQEEKKDFVLVETAGGVLSPGPTGSLQGDIYSFLRLPTILVGDGRLGGISATLTALESLDQRGYNVRAVAVIDDKEERYGNVDYLSSHFLTRAEKTLMFSFSSLPPEEEPLDSWYKLHHHIFESAIESLTSEPLSLHPDYGLS